MKKSELCIPAISLVAQHLIHGLNIEVIVEELVDRANLPKDRDVELKKRYIRDKILNAKDEYDKLDPNDKEYDNKLSDIVFHVAYMLG